MQVSEDVPEARYFFALIFSDFVFSTFLLAFEGS